MTELFNNPTSDGHPAQSLHWIIRSFPRRTTNVANSKACVIVCFLSLIFAFEPGQCFSIPQSFTLSTWTFFKVIFLSSHNVVWTIHYARSLRVSSRQWTKPHLHPWTKLPITHHSWTKLSHPISPPPTKYKVFEQNRLLSTAFSCTIARMDSLIFILHLFSFRLFFIFIFQRATYLHVSNT